MDSNELVQKYDSWHKSLSLREKEGYTLSKIWYQKTIANLPDLNGMNVLEVGCGRGEFSSFIRAQFPKAKIVATDFSAGAIEVCKDKYQGDVNLSFLVEDVQALSFADSVFDFVICCETLEHVPDVKRAVKEIARVLKKGGGFIVTTPSYLNAYALVWLKCWILKRPFESGEGTQPFEHFYTYRYVLGLFRGNGLKIQRKLSTHFQWFVWPGVDPAKLRTVEFKMPVWNRIARPFGFHFFYKGIK
jgi:ubiquinone/menaquinone biosynthesis C-methylase UbiE